MLDYLKALTFDFQRNGERISAVLVYAQPDSDQPGRYRAVVATETGFEGIACLDDTARAASLALAIHERSGSPAALHLAQRWLSFVKYMQYPDGQFANFIRNAAGIRNATGPTSVKGGYAWSMRALKALALAYRVTGDSRYLEQYRACRLEPIPDGKVAAVLGLAALEVYRAEPSAEHRSDVVRHCEMVLKVMGNSLYFRDAPGTDSIHFWGYSQLHLMAAASVEFDRPEWLVPCRRTVANIVEPDVRARCWHTFPDRERNGVCAYDVAPLVQGLTAMYTATRSQSYRHLALQAAAWFYGRNEARTPMYDPTVGMCRDGITNGDASANYGAESAIEAGFAELERRALLSKP